MLASSHEREEQDLCQTTHPSFFLDGLGLGQPSLPILGARGEKVLQPDLHVKGVSKSRRLLGRRLNQCVSSGCKILPYSFDQPTGIEASNIGNIHPPYIGLVLPLRPVRRYYAVRRSLRNPSELPCLDSGPLPARQNGTQPCRHTGHPLPQS